MDGGKHTALNLGIAEINTELTFIVASDDLLKADHSGTSRRSCQNPFI